MLTPICAKCSQVIPSTDINVGANVAFCRSCNLAHQLSDLARGTGIDPSVDVNQPPAGTWRRNSGYGTVIGASHRSVGSAIAIFLFAAFWNGIVSVFVGLALASTLALLGIKPPGWLPVPSSDGGPIGLGFTIFLWLFLTPFIAIGLAMIFAFFSCLAGKTEIRVRDWQGEIFRGIGPLGLTKKFKTELVKEIRIEDRQWRDSDGDRRRNTHIVVEMKEGKAIKFASSLAEDRRQFLAAAMREAILA
jgi:hypothetical protein